MLRKKRVEPEDLVELGEPLGRLAYRMRRGIPSLGRYHDEEDLVQEVFLQSIERLDEFEGRSSLRTWVTSLAQRRLIDMGRRAAIRPVPGGEAVEASRAPEGSDPDRAERYRARTLELLSWLRQDGRSEVPEGFEVFKVLLEDQPDPEDAAFQLTLRTGEPWTAERVQAVVRRVKKTTFGRAFCEDIGAPVEEPERPRPSAWERAAERFRSLEDQPDTEEGSR